MKEIINRLLSETPTFFKRVVYLGLSLGAAGLALKEPHVAELLPPVVNTISNHMITAGVIASALGKLTVKNPNDLNK